MVVCSDLKPVLQAEVLMARRRKKTFECGHQGFGQYCHLCKQKSKEKQPIETAKHCLQKHGVESCELPQKVLLRAAKIVEELITKNVPYQNFKGKRFNWDRNQISIPLPRNYRLLCQEVNGDILPKKVMTHEAYNRYSSP